MSLPDEAMKLKDGKIIYDQLASMVAVQYAEAESNPAGSYVIYNGSVYLLPNGHTANTSWANTEKEGPTNIGEKLSSQLTQITNGKEALEVPFVFSDTETATLTNSVSMANMDTRYGTTQKSTSAGQKTFTFSNGSEVNPTIADRNLGLGNHKWLIGFKYRITKNDPTTGDPQSMLYRFGNNVDANKFYAPYAYDEWVAYSIVYTVDLTEIALSVYNFSPAPASNAFDWEVKDYYAYDVTGLSDDLIEYIKSQQNDDFQDGTVTYTKNMEYRTDDTLAIRGKVADSYETGRRIQNVADGLNRIDVVSQDIAQWLYKENCYINASFVFTDYTGFNTYRIPLENTECIIMKWTGSTPIGLLNENYRYTLETGSGLSRSLGAFNERYISNDKVWMIVAPQGTKAIYITLDPTKLNGFVICKNTLRKYFNACDYAEQFIIPINDSTSIDTGYYINTTYGIYKLNDSYHTWMFHVKAGDTLICRSTALAYNAEFVDTEGEVTKFTGTTHTFETDAFVVAFESNSDIPGIVVIPSGAKLKVDYSNILNAPDKNTFYGMQGVAFGTSLTARPKSGNPGYLTHLPSLSGITFDNQGIGSSYIKGNMLTAIKGYESYSGKRVCIIEGFVNDWYYDKPLGTWDDSTENSACGCLRSAINYIFSQNANITLFVVLDHYGRNYSNDNRSTTATNTADLTQYEYYEELAKVAESLGVPVIKEYAESQISENTPQYLADYVHLSALGAVQSANFIWSKMRQYIVNQQS